MQAGSATRGVSIVRDFLRRRRTEILALWRRGARELPATSDLAPVRLIDHVPELLDQLADIADEIAADPGASVGFETARRHALDRIADGLLIGEVIQELSLLRACILDCWASERMSDTDALRSMQLAIDRAIAVTVARYAEGNADERFKQVAAERERVLAKLE